MMVSRTKLCSVEQEQLSPPNYKSLSICPYKALFGFNPKLGLASSSIPLSIAKKLPSEDELHAILESEKKTRKK